MSDLRERAMRALGSNSVRQAVAKVRAVIGPQEIPDSEAAAQSALDKLHDGETPTAEELTALEIVVRLLRPVVFCRNGALQDLPEDAAHNLHPQELKDLWRGFQARMQGLLGSIGRVETAGGVHVGSGFLVAPSMLATNRHVLAALTFGSEALNPGGARVVFRQEAGSPNVASDIVPILGVAAVHPTLDMALLRLDGGGRPALPIDPGHVAQGDRVAAIGFPGDDPVNNPLFLSGVFNGKFGVKRAALGEILDGSGPQSLFHDCSTTQGNSGSPLLSLTTGQVAGIHRAGYFMYRNEAVTGAELAGFVGGASA